MTIAARLLSLNAVGLQIEKRHVLRDINLNSDARRVAVLGRNGSGKTTLARVMAGLEKPTTGKVSIAGIDVQNDRRGALGAVGILFQNPDQQIIFPTVNEEISFGLRQMGFDKTAVDHRVKQVLAQFGKVSWYDAAIHQLSQGQRQLVCLMSILAMAPRVIILDEPFAGLDIPTAMHLTRVLDGAVAALVHITHDPKTVLHYDHAVWIDGGAVQMEGPVKSVIPAFETAMQDLGAQDDLTDITS